MKLPGLFAASALLLLAVGQAEALPVGPSPAASGETGIVLARGGCGFGAHRGPYGGCRLNRGPRGDIRRAITGAPRGCSPSLYRVRGVCRR